MSNLAPDTRIFEVVPFDVIIYPSFAAFNKDIGPVAPSGPVAPVAPVGPDDPVGPVEPRSPIGPVSPGRPIE